MRKSFVTAAVLPLLTLPGVAPADTSLGIRGGTLGGGVELSYALSQASTHGDSAPAALSGSWKRAGDLPALSSRAASQPQSASFVKAPRPLTEDLSCRLPNPP